MLNENEMNSQFDANYLGDYDLNSLTNIIGVEHYKVTWNKNNNEKKY